MLVPLRVPSHPEPVEAAPGGARRVPTYLRVVVTTTCNMSCRYCHAEGDWQQGSEARGLPVEVLEPLFAVARAQGVRKIKLLGGEPFLRPDFADVVRAARRACPDADVSAITAGAVPARRIAEAFDAGLSRLNVSLHGFTPEALRARMAGGSARGHARAHAQREAFVEELLRHGRPVKLNFVYSGTEDADLAALLAWAAPRGLLVNVLDDLGQDLAVADLERVLVRLRGQPARVTRCVDPDSLDTAHWHWNDGLRVELKDERLGLHAPFAACARCPRRPGCKEGVIAWRLTHAGLLVPCLDRPDLALPVADVLRREGPEAAARAWAAFAERL